MDDVKKIINKKLNKIGLRKKMDEMAIVNYTANFLKENLNQIHPQEISFYNRNLIVKVENSIEANELKFFEEELKFYLSQKGYKINKLRITF
jgi:hypothetical protein